MIIKEKTPAQASNRFDQAGNAAEKQMAFYLRRQFGDDPGVNVFHDLRLQRDDEVAQFDHLILHKHGFIIIESKSVTGEIHINDQLEFTRVFGKQQRGMPSPIQQARRQGELLKKLLLDHKEALRNKVLLGLIQGGFQSCPMQVLVAISDQGIIRRPRNIEIPELHKADRIADEAQTIIKRHRQAGKLMAKPDGDWGLYSFNPDEFDRVTDFFLGQHVSNAPAESVALEHRHPELGKSASTSSGTIHKAMPTYLCMHCHSTNLMILYGRSYYFKCMACDGNTPIRNVCRVCGGNTRTKKRAREFTSICSDCQHTAGFFVNPA